MLFPAVRSGECCALLVSTKVGNPQSNCFVPMTPIGPRKHPAMPSKTSVGKICCPICHCPRMPMAYSRTDKRILDSTLNTRPCLTSCLDFKDRSYSIRQMMSLHLIYIAKRRGLQMHSTATAISTKTRIAWPRASQNRMQNLCAGAQHRALAYHNMFTKSRRNIFHFKLSCKNQLRVQDKGSFNCRLMRFLNFETATHFVAK